METGDAVMDATFVLLQRRLTPPRRVFGWFHLNFRLNLNVYLLSAESDDHHPASGSSAENGMTKYDRARTTRTDVCAAYIRNPSSLSSHSLSSPISST
jgi:hypothetical protein